MSISSVRKSRTAGIPSGSSYYAEYENKISRRNVNPPLPAFTHGRPSVLEPGLRSRPRRAEKRSACAKPQEQHRARIRADPLIKVGGMRFAFPPHKRWSLGE